MIVAASPSGPVLLDADGPVVDEVEAGVVVTRDSTEVEVGDGSVVVPEPSVLVVGMVLVEATVVVGNVVVVGDGVVVVVGDGVVGTTIMIVVEPHESLQA